MKKEYLFTGKVIKIISLITLIGMFLLLILLMIFVFNVIALILSLIFLALLAYLIFLGCKRKIIIDEDTLTVVELFTDTINAKEIESIDCDRIGKILIKTQTETIICCGYICLKFPNEEKNKKLVEELNNWLKKYKNVKGAFVK